MRINIAASHRFHLLDLARELELLGHDVRFYSYVPTKRALQYGLKKESSFSLLFIMLPFLGLVKLSKKASWSLKLINWALDSYLTFFMKPCDVYIALGTVYKNSLVSAKKKFNAITILEWGSKHIEEQQRILSLIPKVVQQDKYFINRSLAGYKLADYIAIASDHVKQSFIERGVSEQKLIQNPYGVDLSMFAPTELSSEKNYDIIMVGGWSYRKGCDLLIEYFKNSELTFLHVGSIVDLSFPDFDNMTHVDSVDQKKLLEYYKKAKIFILVSREEGLAMVQSQALACGLPIVCTKDTGGRDLRGFLQDKKWIIELQNFTIQDLDSSIKEALVLAQTQMGLRSYSTNVSDSLNWNAYGGRYNKNLEKILKLN
ncbi:glycosyltransferase family 4 protein [Flavobacterium sp. CF136]|uniref:glycosyltransferase family 4 protein n=1 Tax=Flavobacterium sp. (strain CF136) TaxID=1144313 RepID=UPI000271B02C|nr:glycosyltransferase family 4 protein [Flavobacterium sp. CF136]EJL65380.1 glycosyltransferase [Flavobacterium sp. CF136]